MSQYQTNQDFEDIYCKRNPLHHKKPLSYFCLDKSCSLSRIICSLCRIQDHKKHRVGRIDKLIEPLSKLCMNSDHQGAIEDHDYLSQKLHQISNEWLKLHEMYQNHAQQLAQGIFFQLQTIVKTFTKQEVNNAYKILKSKQSKIEEIDQVIRRINFLDKKEFEDVETVKAYTDALTSRVKKSINKTASKIDYVFRKMQQYIKESDFTNIDKYNVNTVNPEPSIEEEKEGKEQDRGKEEEMDQTNPVAKNRSKVIHESHNSNNKFKAQQKSEPEYEAPKLSNMNSLLSKNSSRRYH